MSIARGVRPTMIPGLCAAALVLFGGVSQGEDGEVGDSREFSVRTSEGEEVATGRLSSSADGESMLDRLRLSAPDGTDVLLVAEFNRERSEGRYRVEESTSGWWIEEVLEVTYGGPPPPTVEEFVRLNEEGRLLESHAVRMSSGFEIVWRETEGRSDKHAHEDLVGMINEAEPLDLGMAPGGLPPTLAWASSILKGGRVGNLIGNPSYAGFLELVSIVINRSGGGRSEEAGAVTGIEDARGDNSEFRVEEVQASPVSQPGAIAAEGISPPG